MTDAKSYKDTVNLPQTKFDMRANATKKEPEIQKFWQDEQIYEKLAQNNPKDPFILHDGPPYANGDLHMGHALNKILKDIINKYKLLQGHKVRYVPGWDCHGLPIELKVLQNMDQQTREGLTPLKTRYKARDFALKTQQKQAEGFKRYGIWGDWENPYLTLNPEYEAAQIEVFGQMALKGYIYRGLKPVHWSPSSQTALAEAELEYPEGHTSRSVYVAFKVTELSNKAHNILSEYKEDLAVAIWTTTPWTLPGNLAVAINGELDYAVVQASSLLQSETNKQDACYTGAKYLIVAQDLAQKLTETLGIQLTVKTTFKGKILEHCQYKHPLFERQSPVVIGGDYITTESGTGLVHTAPGHGQEDYFTGQKYHLPILCPVDANGNFTEEAGQFSGLNVLDKTAKGANQTIINVLKDCGALLKEEAYQHKYPYDWRTKEPTIFRATEQWFASVEGFRNQALEAIKNVKWIPAIGENRITAMVADRGDWCISRQRAWGVPIPVFYDIETGEALLTEETVNFVKEIIRKEGSDAWWKMSVEELLPPSYRNNGKTYRKGMDTMDVWFDSGSSWNAVANTREELKYPVDLYLEGSDQHRGWFQSSLLTSVAVNGIAPYKTVLTHGFVLDEKGYKMSKSLGNIVDPNIIINGGKNQKLEPPYGADVLRLWVSSVDYSSDVPIGNTILKQLSDVYRKIRNTARFLLGNINDFNPKTDAIAYEDLPELDKYMLHQMSNILTEITEAFEEYQFFKFFQKVQNFCVVDLSNFYLDVAKDRLYISDLNSPRRRSCQTVMAIIVENLAKVIAPVLSHMAEDIWQNLPYQTGFKSVFESGWLQLETQWQENPEILAKGEKLRNIRTGVNQILEKARTEKLIGSSLEAKILIYATDPNLRDFLEKMNVEYSSPSELNYDSNNSEIESVIKNIQQTTVEANLKAQQATIEANLKAQETAIKANFASLEQKTDLGNYTKSVIAILETQTIATKAILNEQINQATLEANLKAQKATLEQNLVAQESAIKSIQSVLLEQSSTNLLVSNNVDELRYLMLVSQVEIVTDEAKINESNYHDVINLSDGNLKIAVVKADGEKCDRCWNYSVKVGEFKDDPTICERCNDALVGKF